MDSKVCIYLRKSREDEEKEKELGKGATLENHRKELLKYAKKHNLNIVKIHEELVSGDSLWFRPAMQELLDEVKQGLYDAVLVMEKERLGRGDMEEQGYILNVFKKSKTKIITPQKIYDLNNELDETYSEFEALFARMEYRTITRRMQGGRVHSVEEGNYIATNPPYGYLITEDKCSRYLIPNPNQALVVKMIFDMYANKNMGSGNIANELNRLGYKSYTGINWTKSSILNIIKNQIYIGKIIWKKKQIRKSTTPGKKKDTKMRPESEWVVAKGKHEPLVDIDTFNKAQKILKSKYHIPYQLVNGPSNPLAGLIICKNCGSKMVKRPYSDKAPHIVCINACGNKSSRFDYVENKLIGELKKWLENYKSDIKPANEIRNNIVVYRKQLEELQNELKNLNTQKLRLHDLLEQGVYDVNTFVERSNNIGERTSALNESIKNVLALIESEENESGSKNILPKIKNILDTYYLAENVTEKNLLLKSVLEKVEYFKEKSQKGDNFTLIIYPKL